MESNSADVILIDRWSLSGVVYSDIRLTDSYANISPDYYTSLTANELVPDLTVLIQQNPAVIV